MAGNQHFNCILFPDFLTGAPEPSTEETAAGGLVDASGGALLGGLRLFSSVRLSVDVRAAAEERGVEDLGSRGCFIVPVVFVARLLPLLY